MSINSKKSLLQSILEGQSDFQFVGIPRDASLEIPEALFAYFVSVLRDDQPELPEASISEWKQLLQFCRAHFMQPLFNWKLQGATKDQRPPKVIMRELQISYLHSVARTVRAENQLKEILLAFQKEGVPFLVLKGPSLANFLYPNPATRLYTDLDILIHPGQFEKARRTICGLGYKSKHDLPELVRDAICEEQFTSNAKERPFIIELHWHVHHFFKTSFGETIDDLFDRSRSVSTSSFGIETFGDADNLIFLCLHVLNHYKNLRLLWLYDIALFLSRLQDRTEWKLLRERSSLWNATLVMTKAIDLTSVWFKPALSEYYAEYFVNTDIGEGEVDRYTLGIHMDDLTTRLRVFLDERPLVWEKFVMILKLIFPSPSYVRVGYPPAHPCLLPFSYLKRWHFWMKRALRLG